MDDTEACVGEGETGRQAGPGHVHPCGMVVWMREHTWESDADPFEAGFAQRIGHEVGASADPGFEELAEGIDAGKGGGGVGQIPGQDRIDEGDAWEESGMAEADLDLMFGGIEDGVAGDFGTGTGGGGDGDDGERRMLEGTAATDDLEIFEGIAGVGGEGGDGFGGVDDGAAADGDDDFGSRLASGERTGEGVGNAGFAGDGKRSDDWNGGVERVMEGVPAFRVGSGDEEAARAETLDDLGQFAAGVFAESDATGSGPVELGWVHTGRWMG